MADLSAATVASASPLLATAANLLRLEDWDGAMAAAEARISDPAMQADALVVLAAVAYRSGQFVTAIQLLSHLVETNTKTSDVPELLAVLNCRIGHMSEALYYGKLGAVVKPDHRYIPLFGPTFPTFADAFRSMGTKPLLAEARKFIEAGRADKAAPLLEQHLEAFPADVEALDVYGLALMVAGRPHDTIGILRSALTLGGPSATVLGRLGQALVQVGDVEAGIACHREATARAPQAAALWAAQLRDLDYLPWIDSAAHRAARDGLTELLAKAQPKTPRRPPPAVEKPVLTIGYLCSSTQDEATRAMVTTIARAHDRSVVTVVGFGGGELSIPANISFRGAFDRWRNIANVDELTLSALVRGEGIDVLVDTDGLFASERLGLFARNPAPVQVSWLHLPEGFALPGAHLGLADAVEAGVGPLLLDRADLSLARPAAEAEQNLVFGADVNLAELNAEVIRTFSAVLQAVPHATLLLMDRGLTQEAAIEKLIQGFGNFGVSHRVDVVGGASEDEFFSQVDVALAPFPAARPIPYGRALSRGVPVIALAQGRSALLARSITAIGVDAARMVAGDTAAYVALARQWAENPAALAEFRATAPAAINASPVFQPASYAAALERLYRSQVAAKAATQA